MVLSFNTSAWLSLNWQTLGWKWITRPPLTSVRNTVWLVQPGTLKICKSFLTIWGSSSRRYTPQLVSQRRPIYSLEVSNRASIIGVREKTMISLLVRLTPWQPESLWTLNLKRSYRGESISYSQRSHSMRYKKRDKSSSQLYKISVLRAAAWCSSSPSTCKPSSYS